jgi:acetyl esterase/lipase
VGHDWSRPVTDLPVVPLWPDGGWGPGTPDPGAGDPGCAGLVPAVLPFPLDHHAPAVVILPGGGYGGRAESHEGVDVARWLNGLGVAAFVVRYRVAPWRHPAPLADARRALRLVRANAALWRVDPQRVAVLGFSAGGHLALSTTYAGAVAAPTGDDAVAAHSARPDACIACYPVASAGRHRHGASFANLFGGSETEAAARAAASGLSCEDTVTPGAPPAFLWHTADDAAVPVQNTYLMAAALAAAGVPHACHVFPHGDHGVGLAPGHRVLAQWPALAAAWLTELGWR